MPAASTVVVKCSDIRDFWPCHALNDGLTVEIAEPDTRGSRRSPVHAGQLAPAEEVVMTSAAYESAGLV